MKLIISLAIVIIALPSCSLKVNPDGSKSVIIEGVQVSELAKIYAHK